MMTAPPMVGVPFFVLWVVGPSSRMNWPYPLAASQWMNHRVPTRVPIIDTAPASRMFFTPEPPYPRTQRAPPVPAPGLGML